MRKSTFLITMSFGLLSPAFYFLGRCHQAVADETSFDHWLYAGILTVVILACSVILAIRYSGAGKKGLM
jgi:hypothetical protein